MCNGRIVSSLEGGYQIGGEFYSAFARSVKAHVGVMCGPEGKSLSNVYREDHALLEKGLEEQVRYLVIVPYQYFLFFEYVFCMIRQFDRFTRKDD